jgi:hypothetical protein
MRIRKFQVSSTNNQIIANDQITITRKIRILNSVIGIYLEFRIWDLGFFR